MRSEAQWQALFVPTATSSLRGYTRTRNYLILSVMDKVFVVSASFPCLLLSFAFSFPV